MASLEESVAATSSVPIQTFVFFDLETTGLPGPGSRPRIAEISMVAVHRNNLSEECSQRGVPRVMDKLSLCVYPMKSMEAGASSVTGLYNDTLYWHKDFDQTSATMIQLFLKRHESPLCLIAHNGNRFDFALLRSELASIKESLPDDILCVDSLLMFYDLDNVRSYPPVTKRIPIRKLFSDESEAKMNQSQETPMKNQSTSTSDGDDQIENSENGVLKRRKLNISQIRRKLEYVGQEDQNDSSSLKDFNSNTVEHAERYALDESNKFSTAKSSTTTLPGCSKWDDKEKKMIESLKCSYNKTESESSSGASSTDTLPILGKDDIENETMSTLQQMSTFQLENASSDTSTVCMSGVSSGKPCSIFDSQQTVNYVDCSQSNNQCSQRSIPMPTSTDEDHTESNWHLLGSDKMSDSDLLKACEQTTKEPQAKCPNSQASMCDSVLGELDISNEQLLKHLKASEQSSHIVNPNLATPPKKPAERNSPPKTPKPTSPGSKLFYARKQQEFQQQGTRAPKKKLYKLADLHTRILGYEPPCSHTAEDDALSLVRIFYRLSSKLLPWVDTHAAELNSIPYMYEPRKRNVLPTGVFPHQM